MRRALMRMTTMWTFAVLCLGEIGSATAEGLHRLVADLQPGMAEARLPEAKFVATPLQVRHLPFPQSTCVFGQPGVSPQSADYLSAMVLNHAVGGGTLTSRLFIEMREKRGLVYSVRTSLETLRGANLLVGRRIGAVEPEVVRTTARRVIRPEALSFAVAGDPEGL